MLLTDYTEQQVAEVSGQDEEQGYDARGHTRERADPGRAAVGSGSKPICRRELLTAICAVSSVPPRCAPRHPGNAHWCTWTPDYGLGSRDEALYPRDRKLLSKFEPTKHDDSGKNCDSYSFRHAHWAAPVLK
jgi:YD repeat-containing protein